jgi:hypothetical protein
MEEDCFELTTPDEDPDLKFATDLLDQDNIRWMIEKRGNGTGAVYVLWREWGGLWVEKRRTVELYV